jgi:zinc protease
MLVCCWGLDAGAEPSVAATPSVAAAPIERFQLSNGLRVVLAPDRVTAGVSVVVHYDVGTAHAPQGFRGISHLLEHLTFRGSRHLAPLQGMGILQELGAGFNATTGLEATDYYTQIAAQGLETVLWLESERMAFTLDRLDQAALDIEQRIVDNEHRQRQHSWASLIGRYWLRALYGNGHPFVASPGELDDVSGVTLRGVQWFFQTAYRPDNATLALVGKFDVARARSLIEKYFGPVVSPALARTSLLAGAPRLCGVHRLGLSHAGLFGHLLRFTWPLPVAGSALERSSVEVTAQLLERRLHGSLVQRRADVASLHVSVDRFSTHELLTVDLELHEDADARAVEQLALAEVRAFSKQEPGARELRTVRANLISRAVFQRGNGPARARDLAEGRDPDAEAAALRVLQAPQVLHAAHPLAGPVLVLHAWPSKREDGEHIVEQDDNPCP